MVDCQFDASLLAHPNHSVALSQRSRHWLFAENKPGSGFGGSARVLAVGRSGGRDYYTFGLSLGEHLGGAGKLLFRGNLVLRACPRQGIRSLVANGDQIQFKFANCLEVPSPHAAGADDGCSQEMVLSLSICKLEQSPRARVWSEIQSW